MEATVIKQVSPLLTEGSKLILQGEHFVLQDHEKGYEDTTLRKGLFRRKITYNSPNFYHKDVVLDNEEFFKVTK